MSAGEVEEYLLDQEDDGSVVGSGEFSVNWRKARSRLSSHNLIRPTAWVLYLVQAAVQWKCQSLDIVQSRYLTRFSFGFPPGGAPTATDFEEALSSLQVNAETPLGKLALVAEHLRLLPESRFQVKFRGSQDAVESLDFGELQWYDRFRNQKYDTIAFDVNHWRRPDANELLPILPARRAQLEIQTELDHYCGPCPIPITLDSVPFQGLLRDIDKGNEDHGSREPWFIQTFRGRLPDLAPPWGLNKLVESKDSPKVQAAISGVVQAGLGQPLNTSQPSAELKAHSKILWVRQGVVTQTTLFPWTSHILALSVVVSADGLTSDLTGFQLVENEEMAARVKTIEGCVKAAFKENFKASLIGDVEVDSEDHRTTHPVAGSIMFLTIFAPMMAVGSLIAIIGVPFLNPVIIGTGGAIAGSGYWGYKKQPFQVPDEAYVNGCKTALHLDLRRLGVERVERFQ